MKENVSVIVPMYNESATIDELCSRVLALSFVQQLIVVDDASKDDSYERVKAISDQRLCLVKHAVNSGKTAALATGLKHVNGEIVVIQDADLEYNPVELEHLCQPIWEGDADVVYGSRFLVRRASRVLYFYHYVGNKLLSFVSNIFTNKNMSDIETCYKAFRSCVVTSMPITSKRFGFEVEVTAKVCKTSARIYETPISYHGRTYEQGKKITYRDGFAALWYILKYNLYVDMDTRQYVERVNQCLKDLVSVRSR